MTDGGPREGGRVSSKDVARRAGVSQPTVSRVLSGAADVRPETRDKVLTAVADLGYRPNLAGRMLRSRRAVRIGVVMSRDDRASAGLLDRLAVSLDPAGVRLHVFRVDDADIDRIAQELGRCDFDHVVTAAADAAAAPVERG